MKKIVFFVVLILLLIAVPVTVYFVGTQQELRSKAAPATKLSFTPATVTKPVDEQFSVNVQIDTGENSVAAVKLAISFDGTALEAMSITNGPFAPKISASGTVASGIASITVAAESTTKPIKGTGTIAVLRMKGKAPTAAPVTLKFDQTTFASGLGESQANVLTTTGVASITISGGSGATILPTATPTLVPTGVPTSALTPTPTIVQDPATPSAMTVTVEADELNNISDMPLIQGTAPPGSTVTVVIQSDPITAVVIADATTGAWNYTPEVPLDVGHHTVTATAQVPDGTTQTVSLGFAVTTSGVGGGAGDEMPVSGSPLPLMLSLTVAFLCMIIGGVIKLAPIKNT